MTCSWRTPTPLTSSTCTKQTLAYPTQFALKFVCERSSVKTKHHALEPEKPIVNLPMDIKSIYTMLDLSC